MVEVALSNPQNSSKNFWVGKAYFFMEISSLAGMSTYLNQGVFIFKLSRLCSEAVFSLSTQTQMKWGLTGKKWEKGLKANIFYKVYAKTLYLPP